MPNTVAEVLLQFNIDKSKLKESFDQLERVKKNIIAIGGETENVSAILEAFGSIQSGLLKTAAIQNLVSEYQALEDQLGGAEEAAKQLREMLQEIGATEEEIKGAVDQFERLSKAQARAGVIGGVQGKGRGRGNIAASAQQLSTSLNLPGIADASNLANDIFSVGSALTGMGVSIGALGVATFIASPLIIEMVKSIDTFIKGINSGKQALKQALTVTDAYFEALKEGTTESLNEQIDDLTRYRALVEEQLAIVKNAREQGAGDDLGSQIAEGVGSVIGAFKDADDAIAQLEAELSTTSSQIEGYSRALGTSEVASNDAREATEKAAEAEKQLREERQKQLDALLRQAIGKADRQLEFAEFLNSLQGQSSEQLAETKTELERQIEAQKKYQDSLIESSAGSQELRDAFQATIDAIGIQISLLESEKNAITDTLIANTKAEEDRRKAIEETTAAIEKGIDSAADSIANIGDAIREANKKLDAAEDKFAREREEAEIRAGERRADAAGKYNDKLIEIAEQSADAADKALRKLEDKRGELQRDFGREEQAQDRKTADSRLEAQIDAQRDEAKAYRDHLSRLKDIRERSQLNEQEAIQSRDFAALFNIRRRTGADLNKENESFLNERREREIQLQQRLADIDREGQIERRERAIQFQQRIDDARAALQRELAEADNARVAALARAKKARDDELADINLNLQRQIEARARARDQEIATILQTRDSRIRAEIEVQKANTRAATGTANAITTIFGQLIAGIRGTKVRNMATGGNLFGGQSAFVNEPGSSGNESARRGSNVLYFPGMGLFTPSGNTTIDPGRRGGAGGAGANTFQQYNTFTGNNPEQIAAAVEDRMRTMIRSAKAKIGA